MALHGTAADEYILVASPVRVAVVEQFEQVGRERRRLKTNGRLRGRRTRPIEQLAIARWFGFAHAQRGQQSRRRNLGGIAQRLHSGAIDGKADAPASARGNLGDKYLRQRSPVYKRTQWRRLDLH